MMGRTYTIFDHAQLGHQPERKPKKLKPKLLVRHNPFKAIERIQESANFFDAFWSKRK